VVNGVFSIPLEILPSPTSQTSESDSPWQLALREYIGSQENRLVQFAANSLLDSSMRYNPLVLCGSTGTGKTLLATGLLACWRQQHPNESSVFLSGADFCRSYSNAVDTDSLVELRRRFCSAQVFVLDNLDELHRKASAQRELVIILDECLSSGIRVLVTSRQLVSSNSFLSPMLASRLAAGLTVPLQPPGIPARRILLERLATLHQVNIPDTLLNTLAEGLGRLNDCPTVPELNHVILQLGHTAVVTRQPVDERMVNDFLAGQSVQLAPSLNLITDRTAKRFSVSPAQLRSASRRRSVVRARGVAMFLSRKLTGKSLNSIGQYFGKRDHTTVLHACRKTEQMQQTDAEISAAINHLMEGFQVR
jgi:chromosomal replication initiator protein